jgi:Polysaccharide deacetylase
MNPPAIALTVDFEGGIEELPARTTLLALFDRFDVKATFFVLGEKLLRGCRVWFVTFRIADMKSDFHGYRHVPLSNLSLSGFRAEHAQDVFGKL